MLDGGAGIDTVSYYAASRGVGADLAGQVGYDGTSTSTPFNFENANGTGFNDAISGTAAAKRARRALAATIPSATTSPIRRVVIDLAGNVAVQNGIVDTDLELR